MFVERLWRSVNYEKVYLRAHDTVSDARASIGRYLDFLQWPAYTRALTAVLRIKLASTSCRSARQPNSGRSSTYRRGIAVQTTGATSSDATCPAPNSRLHAAQITAYSIKMLSQCHVKLFGSYPARLGGS
jgi:hypothetical protein